MVLIEKVQSDKKKGNNRKLRILYMIASMHIFYLLNFGSFDFLWYRVFFWDPRRLIEYEIQQSHEKCKCYVLSYFIFIDYVYKCSAFYLASNN